MNKLVPPFCDHADGVALRHRVLSRKRVGLHLEFLNGIDGWDIHRAVVGHHAVPRAIEQKAIRAEELPAGHAISDWILVRCVDRTAKRALIEPSVRGVKDYQGQGAAEIQRHFEHLSSCDFRSDIGVIGRQQRRFAVNDHLLAHLPDREEGWIQVNILTNLEDYRVEFKRAKAWSLNLSGCKTQAAAELNENIPVEFVVNLRIVPEILARERYCSAGYPRALWIGQRSRIKTRSMFGSGQKVRKGSLPSPVPGRKTTTRTWRSGIHNACAK